jgi:hypothetical protein
MSIHLCVLVHGMWGNPLHLAELDRILRETHDAESEDGTLLHVLLASTNRWATLSEDGILFLTKQRRQNIRWP